MRRRKQTENLNITIDAKLKAHFFQHMSLEDQVRYHETHKLPLGYAIHTAMRLETPLCTRLIVCLICPYLLKTEPIPLEQLEEVMDMVRTIRKSTCARPSPDACEVGK